MIDLMRRIFKWKRDNNYYAGLWLLLAGTCTIVWYLIFDEFEPWAFLITGAICAWGFALLWKSDNDYRFQLVQQKMLELGEQLQAFQTLAAKPESNHSGCNHTVSGRRRRRLTFSRLA